MKRILVSMIVASAFVVAATAQAVEKTFVVKSSKDSETVLQDVHLSLLDANGEKAAESFGIGRQTFDIPAGDYTVVAEQTSTGASGVLETTVEEEEEDSVADVSVEVETIELILNEDGLQFANRIPDAAPRPSVQTTPRTIRPTQVAQPSPALPPAPAQGSAVGASRPFGALGMLGMVGAVIAVSVANADNAKPVSSMNRYR